MQKAKEGKILNKFQFYVVKSSFSDVKTYEKLIFFHRFFGLAQNHAQSCRMVKKGKFRKYLVSYGKFVFFLCKNL